MKLVTNTKYLERKFGVLKTIDLIAGAGFDGLDYRDINSDTFLGADFRDRAKLMRRGYEENN